MSKRKKQKISKKLSAIVAFLLVLALFLAVAKLSGHDKELKITGQSTTQTAAHSADLDSVPDYSGNPYVIINNNKADFKNSNSVNKSYERYGKLDSLGRCTECEACVGKDLMPSGKRSSISSVKPTGWKTAKYDFIDGKSLYNRCHLLAYQLTGENANAQNLITGTRYMNVSGMLPFEDEVADYVKSTGNHVLYRVTPIFKGEELVARGVHMEAFSVEDGGESVQFNVYCYNIQPGVEINYAYGSSKASGKYTTAANDEDTSKRKVSAAAKTKSTNDSVNEYVVNIKSKKFHRPDCDSVIDMKEQNKKVVRERRSDLIKEGYTPCEACKP